MIRSPNLVNENVACHEKFLESFEFKNSKSEGHKVTGWKQDKCPLSLPRTRLYAVAFLALFSILRASQTARGSGCQRGTDLTGDPCGLVIVLFLLFSVFSATSASYSSV